MWQRLSARRSAELACCRLTASPALEALPDPPAGAFTPGQQVGQYVGIDHCGALFIAGMATPGKQQDITTLQGMLSAGNSACRACLTSISGSASRGSSCP